MASDIRLGQVDALAHALLASPDVYFPDMRTALGLRCLSRAWAHERAIALGEALVGAECAAQRDAFLNLLERALPRREKPLTAAIRLVRTIAIRPLAGEAAETAAIVADSTNELDWVIEALADPRLPNEPLARLLALTERFGFSRGDEADPLAATALTPCSAINLAAAADCRSFRLSATPRPCPGVVSSRMVRSAGKLLGQLEGERLVHGSGPFAPYKCAIKRPLPFPDWRCSARAVQEADWGLELRGEARRARKSGLG